MSGTDAGLFFPSPVSGAGFFGLRISLLAAQLRICAELVHTHNSASIFVERYERPLQSPSLSVACKRR